MSSPETDAWGRINLRGGDFTPQTKYLTTQQCPSDSSVIYLSVFPTCYNDMTLSSKPRNFTDPHPVKATLPRTQTLPPTVRPKQRLSFEECLSAGSLIREVCLPFRGDIPRLGPGLDGNLCREHQATTRDHGHSLISLDSAENPIRAALVGLVLAHQPVRAYFKRIATCARVSPASHRPAQRFWQTSSRFSRGSTLTRARRNLSGLVAALLPAGGDIPVLAPEPYLAALEVSDNPCCCLCISRDFV